MPWFKIDDRFAFHKKALAAGNEAIGAWTRAGSWSSAPENLTEGLIPRATAHIIAPAKVWKRLVEAGLVVPAGADYQIHDYLTYNPSAEKVRAEQRATRERVERLRNGRRNTESNAVTAPVTTGDGTASPGSRIPDPGPRSADPSEARSIPDARSLASIPIPGEGRDLTALALQLQAEGSTFGASVGERAAALKPFSQPQIETLRRIHDERAAVATTPPKGRARPRDHQVQGGPSFIAEVRAAAEKYEPIGDEIL